MTKEELAKKKGIKLNKAPQNPAEALLTTNVDEKNKSVKREEKKEPVKEVKKESIKAKEDKKKEDKETVIPTPNYTDMITPSEEPAKRKRGRPKKRPSEKYTTRTFHTALYLPYEILPFLEEEKLKYNGNRNEAIVQILRRAMENS